MKPYVPSSSPFEPWSPLALAHALGLRIDLRSHRTGERSAHLVGIAEEPPLSHGDMWAVLEAMARGAGIDPAAIPAQPARALLNGKEQ